MVISMTEQIREVYMVNSMTFTGDDAEQQARGYAEMLVKYNYPAMITIPGCKPIDAKDVWDL
jgi:hypothetical protein